MPFFKRFFGQGKSKATSTFVALCIGDYSRVCLPIEGNEAHQLQAFLAHEATSGESTACTSQPAAASSKGSGLGPQTSFRAFRHLIQHLGGGAASSLPQAGAEANAQQHLSQFFKSLGGYPSVTFLTASEDGLITREKVLAKLTKLFKHSTAPVVLVSYCGPSDERGNWRLASQVPATSPGSCSGAGSGGGGGAAAANAAGAVAGTCVLSFREVSMLWQRYRKHSQRLVLLLDCANSGYWVSALRMLSKAEQLELSLGVQASDCSQPGTQGLQLTYQPGIFVQFYLAYNKWRRETRLNILGSAQRRPSQLGRATAANNSSNNITANSSISNNPSVGELRGENWLPGMIPSYYATWLNDNLADYGIGLKFFNVQINLGAAAVGGEVQGGSPDDRFQEARVGSVDPLSIVPPLGVVSHALHHRPWRANTGPLAAIESCRSLGGTSRLGDELTSPVSEPHGLQHSGGVVIGGGCSTGTGGGGSGKAPGLEHEGSEQSSTSELRIGMRAAMALRAVSMQESFRRRFSSLYYDNCTTDGAGGSSTTMPQAIVGSPNTPAMQRVRLSTPQADWHGHGTTLPYANPHSPTLPGDDPFDKLGHGLDGVNHSFARGSSHMASPNAMSPSGSVVVDFGGNTCGYGSAAVVNGSSRLQGRASGGAVDVHASGGTGGGGGAGGDGIQPVSMTPARPVQAVNIVCGESLFLTNRETPEEQDSGFAAAVAAIGDELLVVVPSAPSDSVAMAWGRRSSQAAERCFVDGRDTSDASSLKDIKNRPGGFVNELYGALHEVATERRLRARRAPLEGDESLDTMMEDADLERRASAASLPSFMLPHNLLRGGGESSGSTGRAYPPGLTSTAASGIAAAAVSSPSQPQTAGSKPGTSTAAAPRPSATMLVSASPMPTPRVSAMLGMVAAGEAAGMSQRRQGSRLFYTSLAGRTSGDQLSLEQMDEPAGAADGVGGGGSDGGGGSGDEMEELSISASYDAAATQEQGASRQESYPSSSGEGVQEQQQRPAAAPGVYPVALSLLGTLTSSASAPPPMLLFAAAESTGPTSVEWQPQLADSALLPTPLSQGTSGHLWRRYKVSGGGSAGGGGAAASGSLMRSLLRQHVSIADSVDLDSASLHRQWERRPGRFEMAGSESSSFVFGDDQERFDILRLLREQQEPQLQELGQGQHSHELGQEQEQQGQGTCPEADVCQRCLPVTTAAAAAAAAPGAAVGGSGGGTVVGNQGNRGSGAEDAAAAQAVPRDPPSAAAAVAAGAWHMLRAATGFEDQEIEAKAEEGGQEEVQLADVLLSMDCAVVQSTQEYRS